jgi:hypothetical protein
MKFENPEFAAQRSLNSPEYLHPLIAEAAIKAREVKKAEAIDPTIFESVYGRDAVARDLEYVRSMKTKFGSEDEVHKKYADVFEAVFYENAEMSNWLGENTHTIMTSEFDDIKNGMDVLVRLNDSARAFPYVGMGIDVTFGRNSVEKKMTRVFGEIEKGQLGTVRYFMDPGYAQFKGELSSMPHIIVGVERRHVIELAGQWLREEKRKLGENPIQLVVLEQIMAQLKAYRDYAEGLGRYDLAEIYDADISVFAPVLREKRGMDISDYKDDPVIAELTRALEARKK